MSTALGQFHGVAKGYQYGQMKRIAATFDEDTFAVLTKMAERQHVSTAEIIRQLVAIGLEAAS